MSASCMAYPRWLWGSAGRWACTIGKLAELLQPSLGSSEVTHCIRPPRYYLRCKRRPTGRHVCPQELVIHAKCSLMAQEAVLSQLHCCAFLDMWMFLHLVWTAVVP